MNAQQLKENVIKAEGYAEGFRAGYIACADHIAKELAKKESAGIPISGGPAPEVEPGSN